MNPNTRDSYLMPVGLPLFVGLVIATLVLSMANILLAMTVETAPIFALAVAAAILVLSSLAAVATHDDSFYVQLVGVLICLTIVAIGFVTAAGGEHPQIAIFIPTCAIAAGIVGITLMPRGVATEEEFAEREKLPLRPMIGIAVLFAAAVGVMVYGMIKESDSETTAAAPTATAAATVVATSTPAADGRPIALTAGDNFFEPTNVTAAPNENIVLEVTNTGAAIHNLAIDGGPKVDLVGPGQTQSLGYTTPASGTVGFKCEFHPEMVGTITVQ